MAGQCDYTTVTVDSQTGAYGYEMGWQIVDINGVPLLEFEGGPDNESFTDAVCLQDGCYVFVATDTYGDGWNGGSVSIEINGDVIDVVLPNGFEDEIAFGVNEEGCQVDGPCPATEVIIETNTVAYGAEVSWEIRDTEGNVLYTFQASEDNTGYSDNVCLNDGCYVFVGMDSYGDGWNGGSATIDVNGTLINFNLPDGSQGGLAFGVNETGCELIIPGCTNPDALNYDAAATEDDGSCETIQSYLEAQNITPLIQSGPIHNRVNWGIQNRGVNNPNDAFQSEAEFLQMLEDSLVSTFTVGDPLEKMPYARYRNFFNLDAWWWENAPAEGEGWSWDILKGIRDEYYLPWQDDEHGWATLFSTTKFGGGGGAGVQPETRTGDGLMFGVEYQTLLHEFGHTMPQVPDEYTASGEWSGGQCWEGANTTGFTVLDSIPWRNWIPEGTPLPTPYTGEYENVIGAFEGALTNYFGCHRPTAKGCYMGAGGFGDGFGQDMCAPCRQRTVCLLYRYVDVIENPMPSDTDLEIDGPTTLSFSAEIVKPEPNTQVYTWLLNGEPIAEGVEEIEVAFGSCDSYELTLHVEDTTSWVRYDEKFDMYYPKPEEWHTWTIDNTQVNDYSLSASTTVQNLSCNGEQDGTVSISGTGGQAPYSVYYQGESINEMHSELATGEYNYWLVDDAGCGIQVDATVNQDPLLEVSICTDFDAEWIAEANILNYDPEGLAINWSNGDEGVAAIGFPEGDHEVEITTGTGCTVTTEFSIGPNPSEIIVSETVVQGAGQSPSGAIYLEIEGGIPAYQIDWFDKLARDLTFDSAANSEASGDNFGHLPEMAFDNNLDTKWLQMGTGDQWVSFEFENPELITAYAVTSGDDVEGRDPKDWNFQAWDGGTWITLDTQTDIDFPQRRQRLLFGFDNSNAYDAYRLYVIENSGEDATQLQELEFIGASSEDPFIYNAEMQDHTSRINLPPGDYKYEVRDQYSQCAINTVGVNQYAAFNPTINVIQESTCSVTIENANPDFTYYWFGDQEGNILLHEGNSFAPPAGANYWVAAQDNNTGSLSEYRPGFSISMPEQPEIEEVSEGMLGVVDPNPSLVYRWYDMDCGGTLLAEGNSYEPGDQEVTLYVGSWWAEEFPDPIDPTSVPGLLTRMDAADIDGDGVIDNPSLPTGSMYPWYFNPGSELTNGGWFAYRGNYQNGLGIADFATMWLQCTEEGVNNYRTVIMAYEENLLTWEGSAPFFGLDDVIPYSATPGIQLYSDDVPTSTLAGTTMLNGEVVDPMSTPNPMEFCILAQTMTQGAPWTDCTDTHWEGKVGEILFYDSELSVEELEGISEFLRKKWLSKADLESIRTVVQWDGQSIGINDLEIVTSSVSVYPNPSTGKCLLHLNGSDAQRWEVFTATGNQVQASNIRSGEKMIDLTPVTAPLAAGIYYIRVTHPEGRTETVRFIIY